MVHLSGKINNLVANIGYNLLLQPTNQKQQKNTYSHICFTSFTNHGFHHPTMSMEAIFYMMFLPIHLLY
jgi:hypothetical protein